LLHAHVVDDEQVGLEVLGEDFVVAGEGLVVKEVAHNIEDRAVQDQAALLDGLVAERLDEMTFTSTIAVLL
jgi:hypothetical protein